MSLQIVHEIPSRKRLDRMHAFGLDQCGPKGLGMSTGLWDGASPPFSPNNFAPSLWVRGESLSAGPVSSWTDLSGSGHTYTQGTGANQPGFSSNGGPNGLPCVTFSGTQWLNFTGAYANRRNWTIFMVVKLANTTSIMKAALWGASHGFQGTNSPGAKRELVFPGVADLLDNTSASTTSWELWEAQDNGTNQFFWVNATAHTLSTNASTPAVPTSDNDIGAGNAAGTTNPFTGSIQEIIRYESALSTAQRQSVEAYVRARTAIW